MSDAAVETLENIHDVAVMVGANVMLADGYEDAFLGVVERHPDLLVACYDREKCIEILMTRDGMDRDGAIEFFEFNTLGSIVKNGPVFLTRYAIR